ncbi:phage integrase family protein [Mycobacteroides abscessus subsp. abscessus]|uniref:tyrosine-type recombinase/integrase n=2 Tax=Mycobacteroides abscessus TaxID=36809 RepID=UPI0009293626|nr:site-specific integrase [Mycobacteroides abscessus]MDO3315702.1 site-specific integrase [Mycobacteroides abscessus subsp. abscessus]MDO3343117.1 site-specific integrase [Mycobacteroides abscessus subsp. abscessus]SHP29191.1 phage integrase family protein [Mycobacteroides abscessus subsp. abscessus]SHP46323.1 phage integrase family protein [Mycobacteroides abscessus subsp. abscessus]SHP49334.1 phage integrase family protein [Mycobacteroides abscessus subsp. abscessus]
MTQTQRRNRRSGVEDRWTKANGEPSASHGKGKRWRARYVDDHGQEHAKAFIRKVDAQKWLDNQTAAVVSGTHVPPRDAQLTVGQWCEMWIEGYKVNRESTVRQARTHIAKIVAEFGDASLSALRPSQVKAWVAKLNDEYEPSYVHALHSRLSQIMSDAVHDGVLARNPCSRRTSPPMGKQKPYVATTEQVWALHDAMPEHLRVAVLLGAFVGLRVAEAAALRVDDVDFIRGIVNPAQQWPDKPLKTDGSATPVPIPQDLALLLAASVKRWPSPMMVTRAGESPTAPPWVIEREIRRARTAVPSLPEMFSFHDLRHYLASLLIASGADIKTVQARMRHASARTTLDTYGHLWPDADESTRSAVGAVITERMDSLGATADALRTKAPSGRGRRRSAR